MRLFVKILVPKIIKTAPSPSSDPPPSFKVTPPSYNESNGKSKEISQMESVL